MPAMITRRRDQVTFKGNPVCADQIIGGIIFCESKAGQLAWMKRLNQKHPSRFNYFVCFKDVQSDFALQFGFAEWASVERPYIIW